LILLAQFMQQVYLSSNLVHSGTGLDPVLVIPDFDAALIFVTYGADFEVFLMFIFVNKSRYIWILELHPKKHSIHDMHKSRKNITE
jgi:hypothetical protein